MPNVTPTEELEEIDAPAEGSSLFISAGGGGGGGGGNTATEIPNEQEPSPPPSPPVLGDYLVREQVYGSWDSGAVIAGGEPPTLPTPPPSPPAEMRELAVSEYVE